jgi:hypothetical protein
MSQTAPAPEITGRMLMYDRPVLLNRETHGGLGITPTEQPFSFCAKLRAVPITVLEVSLAMRHYPVIFSTKENPVLLAVLGVIDDVNLFVDAKGNWEQGAYVPSYIRRYPFAVATENDGDRFAIVIDEGFKGIVQGGQLPFFSEGGPSKSTEQAIEFCKAYEQERRATEGALANLAKFDLLTAQAAQYAPPGTTEQRTFAEYFAVDALRLDQLPDDRFVELRKTGLLPVLYAHLMSFSNWRDLLNRRSVRHGLNADTILNRTQLN